VPGARGDPFSSGDSLLLRLLPQCKHAWEGARGNQWEADSRHDQGAPSKHCTDTARHCNVPSTVPVIVHLDHALDDVSWVHRGPESSAPDAPREQERAPAQLRRVFAPAQKLHQAHTAPTAQLGLHTDVRSSQNVLTPALGAVGSCCASLSLVYLCCRSPCLCWPGASGGASAYLLCGLIGPEHGCVPGHLAHERRGEPLEERQGPPLHADDVAGHVHGTGVPHSTRCCCGSGLPHPCHCHRLRHTARWQVRCALRQVLPANGSTTASKRSP